MLSPTINAFEVQNAYNQLPAGVMSAAVVGAVLVALETGFRFGRLPSGKSTLAALQAVVLGLTSLLLAFSFSLAEMRFDERRALAVKDAAAIEGAYLRAGVLPPALRDEVRSRMVEYLQLHIEAPVAAAADASPERYKEILDRNERLQVEFWQVLEVHSAELQPTVLLMMTNAFNELTTVSTQRLAALRARLPWLVVALLFTAIIASGMLVGHQPDAPRRALPQWVLFTVVMGTVMFTLLDLDRPTSGIIRNNRQAMLDLQHFIQVYSAP